MYINTGTPTLPSMFLMNVSAFAFFITLSTSINLIKTFIKIFAQNRFYNFEQRSYAFASEDEAISCAPVFAKSDFASLIASSDSQ